MPGAIGGRKRADLDCGEQRLGVGGSLGELVHLRKHVDRVEARAPFVGLARQPLGQAGVDVDARAGSRRQLRRFDRHARVEAPGDDSKELLVAVVATVLVDLVGKRAQ